MNQSTEVTPKADHPIQKIRIEIEIKIKMRIQKPTNIHPRAEATPIGQKTRRERREDKKIMSGEELAGDEKVPTSQKESHLENKAHLVLKIQI